MRRFLLFAITILVLSGCGPTLRNVTVTVNLPPTRIMVDSEGKAVPVQVNVGSKTISIDMARGATVPLSALGL